MALHPVAGHVVAGLDRAQERALRGLQAAHARLDNQRLEALHIELKTRLIVRESTARVLDER